MKRLSRAVRTSNTGGKPLPRVFNRLPALRRSEVTMIAGQSNAGKSMLALWQGLAWVKLHNLRGIYFSVDSAELGQAARAAAMLAANQMSADDAEARIEAGDEYTLMLLDSIPGLLWSFENDLTYENIDAEVQAFIELWGTTPDFIIVDNLTDIDGQNEDEWGTQRRALKALVQLARVTDSAVVVLHHTGEDTPENPCPPKKAIMGKASQKPAMIWTTSDQGARRPVAVVKDRYGQGVDKTGGTAAYLTLNQTTLHYREL